MGVSTERSCACSLFSASSSEARALLLKPLAVTDLVAEESSTRSGSSVNTSGLSMIAYGCCAVVVEVE